MVANPIRYSIFVRTSFRLTGTREQAEEAGHALRRTLAALLDIE